MRKALLTPVIAGNIQTTAPGDEAVTAAAIRTGKYLAECRDHGPTQ
ncbi:hypothetical protein ACWT_3747 [Actinoplanes sp. SE50]|nr:MULTISPECIES: hypothetical protein [unclassified Actinoplanes]AEV84770.1 hypothetical protein ACPL_3875 [Actinoplanes sp. SE50/110]ATO83162.1 hypothetical protein ACWT_3747 [Actinoplanes sp. SE50]SLM00569.1 hypothetical protein ACSP50_3802 [Actinoplanes sp. SE50/110]